MKCQFCGKPRDDMDRSCKMCTICGWAIEHDASPKSESSEGESSPRVS